MVIVRKMMKQFGFWVISVHPGHAGLHKQRPRLHEHHNHWCRVLGVQVRPGTRHFPYNENPTRALNTTSLKWCLSTTDAIDILKKFTHAYESSRSPYGSTLHWNSSGFCTKRKFGYFSNRAAFAFHIFSQLVTVTVFGLKIARDLSVISCDDASQGQRRQIGKRG